MPAKAVKVAISLPKEEFEVVEALRRRFAISRSAVFLQAIQQWIKAAEQKKKDDQYVEGYRKYPETEEEHLSAAMVAETLADYPWEP